MTPNNAEPARGKTKAGRKASGETRVDRTVSASKKRREKEKLELRRRILKAAGQEFLEYGYEAFSLRRVAERIGYSATTIYLHFQNKDDLIMATVREGFEEFDSELESVAAAHKNPLKRLEALGRTYVKFGLENPTLYRLMFMQRGDFYLMWRMSHQDEADSPEDNEEKPLTIAMTLLVAAVEDAMAAGAVKRGDAQLAADVLWAGAHGLVALGISPLMTPEHAERVLNPLITSLISGLK